MLDAVIPLVLAVHLMCVNVAASGPLICIWLDWRGGGGDETAYRAARYLSFKSLVLFFAGGLLGLVVAALLWNEAYHNLMHAFAYKIRWGAWELVFSAVLMSLHALLVARGPARSLGARLARATIALLTATNLLYHFPSLFIVISEVSAGYLDQPRQVDASLFRRLMTEGSVVTRTVHFWLASIAVTGVTLIEFGRWLLHKESDREVGERVAGWGAWIALVPTCLQILVGLWVLSSLPPLMKQRLLGGDWLVTSLLGLSVVSAFWLMHQLAAVALGERSPRALRMSIGLMWIVVILMTYTSRLALGNPPERSNPSTTLEFNDDVRNHFAAG